MITFLPASNLLFTVGFIFAERVLYLPSIGFCGLIAYAYENVLNLIQAKSVPIRSAKKANNFINLQNLIRLLMLIICLAYSYRTWTRTFDGRNEHTLYSKDLEMNPANVKLLNNLGKLNEQANANEKAFDYYLKSN